MNRRSVSDGILLPACLLLALMACRSPAAPDAGIGNRVAEAVTSIARDRTPCLVQIRSRDMAGEITGTGFLIDPTGTVCTLTSFLRGDDLTVIQGGKEYPATVAAVDSRTGIAFLKTAAGGGSFLQPPAAIPLPEGAPVIGLGAAWKPAEPELGIIRGRLALEGETYHPVPLLVASLPGAVPGSPVLDLGGNLAGIVTSATRDDVTVRILPSSALAKLLDDLMRFGRPMPGWIGAVVEEAAVPEGGSRTRIAAVEPGSPAERAGISAGDGLVAVGGKKIRLPQDVLETSFYLSAGEQVRLTLSRGGVIRNVTLKCAPFPEIAGQTVP
jgi:serine protease Do